MLGQRILVENNGTASGMRATEDVSKAAADGYTLLVGTSSQLVHNIALFDPLPVDVTTTLRGVAMINSAKTPGEVDAYYTEQRETWIPVVRDTGVRRTG